MCFYVSSSISRPILFPFSLNKQPISLARSHNWFSLLSQTTVFYCSVLFDAIQSSLSALNRSFTFSWQTIWPRGNWEWDKDSWLVCVKITKLQAAITRLLRSLRINYYETWETISPLIVVRRQNQIGTFHAIIK